MKTGSARVPARLRDTGIRSPGQARRWRRFIRLLFRALPDEIRSGPHGEIWGKSGRMDLLHNDLGQPIGFPVPNWTPRALPPREPMEGRFCRIEILDPDRHAADLYEAIAEDRDGRSWTYLGYGPFCQLCGISRLGRCRGEVIGSAVPRHRRPCHRQGGRDRELSADRRAGRRDRGRAYPLFAGASEDLGRDRGDVPDDAPRLRRARLSPLRMEVRCPERAPRAALRSGSAIATRASSARPRCTKAATATPPGIR